ncbi:hypothetical protein C8R46DRAFT_1053704 [Mycena filopes]|nr:hypothetical protein C8R46DRAFT_1053704 [Mycena filopes]
MLGRIPLRLAVIAYILLRSYFLPWQSKWNDSSIVLLYIAMGCFLHSVAFTAIAERRGRHAHSDLAPYSLPRHLLQFASPLGYSFAVAACLETQKAAPSPFYSMKFFLGILGTFQKVVPYTGLTIAMEYLPVLVMWLMKRLALEPYKTIWYLGTTVAPRIVLRVFLWLIYMQNLNLERPAFGPMSALIPWLGMTAYAGIAIWKITDITAAYFYNRALTNVKLPSEPFMPKSITRFFVLPLCLPTAMIANDCIYRAPSISAGATTVSLAVVAVFLYDFLAYWVLGLMTARRKREDEVIWQSDVQVKPVPGLFKERRVRRGEQRDRSSGSWLIRPLDELAINVFAFGSADVLKRIREEDKKKL